MLGLCARSETSSVWLFEYTFTRASEASDLTFLTVVSI